MKFALLNGKKLLSRKAALAALVLAAIVTSLPQSGSAAESGRVKVVGLGASGCDEFLSDLTRKPALGRDYLAWAQGFMSGVLIGRPGNIDNGLDLTPESLPLIKQLELLKGYCAQNNTQDFSDAVLMLYKRLRTEGSL